MQLISTETMTNLNNSNFTNLSYLIDRIPNQATYHGSISYLSLFFFTSACTITIEEKVLQIFPGNIIILRPKESYTITFLETSSVNQWNAISPYSYCMHFEKDFFNAQEIVMLSDCPIIYDLLRLESPSNEYLFFDCSLQNVIQEYVNLLLYEASFAQPQNEKNVKYAFILFITRLHYMHYTHLIISESSMMPDYTIGSFLKYMTEHSRDVTLVSMANHFNFHPSYLSSLFKSLSGFTFSEKLLMIRLEQSKRLLLTTNLRIDEIVEMIGFKEKSYYHRCFKRYYQITPSQYRKANSQNRNIGEIKKGTGNL